MCAWWEGGGNSISEAHYGNGIIGKLMTVLNANFARLDNMERGLGNACSFRFPQF